MLISWTRRFVKRVLIVLASLLVILIAARAWDVYHGPELRAWHTKVPPELSAADLDAADWRGFMAAEAKAFDFVRTKITERLPPEDRSPANRYDPASPLHPARFAQDWNRSIILEPTGPMLGAAVLVHGLTDTPFSMRHLAQLYAEAGFLAIVPRMPGHGTVPAGLADAAWPEWAAATRLAVREARRRAPGLPLHLVGYSNGGALVLRHALEEAESASAALPDQLVLISPMVGVTPFARFAGLAGLPALLPAFAGAAWLSVLPEFNPFKFNSFPVNAARQSHQLTVEVQNRLRRLADSGRLDRLPPVLTFQSVVDSTVSTSAVITALHARLPAGKSELVLFDLNREERFGPLLSPGADAALAAIPAAPRGFGLTLVTNLAADGAAVEARSTPAGSTEEARRALGLAWPRGLFSLSHVALTFPVEDGLYGLAPAAHDDFGIRLGAIAPRGESGVLVMSLDALMRASSNPFFPYLRERVEGILPMPAGTPRAASGRAADPAARPAR
ncbi:MAG: alpha/beta hydrolase [Roseomonas sp.]|nr:alpha/beta hydrolase [Roseomonas sp.]